MPGSSRICSWERGHWGADSNAPCITILPQVDEIEQRHGQIVGSLHKEVAERKMAIERLKRDLDTEKREHLRNVIKVLC